MNITKMLRPVIILGTITILGISSSYACTTMLFTKGTTKDGSVFIAHSDDTEMFDNRLVYVPAADHKPGAMRPISYDASSLGNRSAFNANAPEALCRFIQRACLSR